jgi:hypothetical protein
MLNEATMHDNTVVVFGPCIDDAWALVGSAPLMQLHLSEAAVDELKQHDSGLRYACVIVYMMYYVRPACMCVYVCALVRS